MGLRRERSLEVSGSGVGSGWGGGGSSEWVSGGVPVTSVTGGVRSTGHRAVGAVGTVGHGESVSSDWGARSRMICGSEELLRFVDRDGLACWLIVTTDIENGRMVDGE